MAHLLTKHRPGRKEEQPPVADSTRLVDIPSRLRAGGGAINAVNRADSVALGYSDPPDGRYVSLARTSYQHRAVKPAGEAIVFPAHISQIVAEKQHRSRLNNERQFYLGPSEDEVDRFVLERVQSGTPTSTMLRTASRSGTASPPPKFCAEDGEESRKNAHAMRACHLYISAVDQAAWKSGSASSMRTDMGNGASGASTISPQERAALRTSQRSTHFKLGSDSAQLQSEAQGCFRGESVKDRSMSLIGKKSAVSSVQLGMSLVNVQDTLKTLVQVDYVPHTDALRSIQEERRTASKMANTGAVVTAETDSLVLGYDGVKQRLPLPLVSSDSRRTPTPSFAGAVRSDVSPQRMTTLYRTSYTPLSFV